jgi:hypothetical protein
MAPTSGLAARSTTRKRSWPEGSATQESGEPQGILGVGACPDQAAKRPRLTFYSAAATPSSSMTTPSKRGRCLPPRNHHRGDASDDHLQRASWEISTEAAILQRHDKPSGHIGFLGCAASDSVNDGDALLFLRVAINDTLRYQLLLLYYRTKSLTHMAESYHARNIPVGTGHTGPCWTGSDAVYSIQRACMFKADISGSGERTLLLMLDPTT